MRFRAFSFAAVAGLALLLGGCPQPPPADTQSGQEAGAENAVDSTATDATPPNADNPPADAGGDRTNDAPVGDSVNDGGVGGGRRGGGVAGERPTPGNSNGTAVAPSRDRLDDVANANANTTVNTNSNSPRGRVGR